MVTWKKQRGTVWTVKLRKKRFQASLTASLLQLVEVQKFMFKKSSTRLVKRDSNLIANRRRSVSRKKVICMEMQPRDARWVSHRVEVRMQLSNYRVGRGRKIARSQKWFVWGEKKY